MARDTNRNNIKPVLFIVAEIVVVLLCLFATRTSQGFNGLHFIGDNSMIDSIFCFVLFRMSDVISFYNGFEFVCFSKSCYLSLALFRLGITFLSSSHGQPIAFGLLVFTFYGPAVFAVPIFSPNCRLQHSAFVSSLVFSAANFTLRIVTVFSCAGFVKARKMFGFLASGTSFCYNRLRHGFCSFNSEKLCLEPLQAQYLCGSLYSITMPGGVK